MRPLAFVLAVTLCRAEEPPAEGDLKNLDLEQILKLEVTSVRKKRQQVQRSSAAVSVITRADMERSGMNSLPEVLRMVPGVQVAQINSHSWAISIRGFGDQYANKLLVMLDGRSVYSPIMGGVFWDMMDYPLEMIERIEVIRGPAASEWGGNAVNGVINIITRRASESIGTSASLVGGTGLQASGTVTHGSSIGADAAYMVYGQYTRRSSWPSIGQAGRLDPFNGGKMGFRLDWNHGASDSLTLQGDAFQFGGESTSADTSLLGNTAPFRARGFGGGLLGRWSHSHANGSETTLQFYADHANRNAEFLPLQTTTLDFDLQHRFRLSSRHQLQFGLGAREAFDSSRPGANTAFVPASQSYFTPSFTVTDDISLVPERLLMTIGVRTEHNPFSGWNAQPSTSLAYTPTRTHTIWGSVSNAVRTPTRSEIAIEARYFGDSPIGPIPFLIHRNPGFRPERIWSYQVGYRWQQSARFSIDIATYISQYSRVRLYVLGDFEPLPGPIPIFVPTIYPDNGASFTLTGGEVATTFRPLQNLTLSSSVTLLRTRIHPLTRAISAGALTDLQNSPAHQWQGHSNWKLGRNWNWNVSAYYVGRIQNMYGVPSYVRLDNTLSYRLTDSAEVFAGGLNLLTPRHLEFFQNSGPGLSYVHRSFQFGFRHRIR